MIQNVCIGAAGDTYIAALESAGVYLAESVALRHRQWTAVSCPVGAITWQEIDSVDATNMCSDSGW